MSRKNVILTALVGVMLVSTGVFGYLAFQLSVATQTAMATGDAVQASPMTWLTMIASLFGIPISGGAAALVAWLMKTAKDGLPSAPGSDVIRRVVSTGEIGVYLYLTTKAVGGEKVALIAAARALCDRQRDEWFPAEGAPAP